MHQSLFAVLYNSTLQFSYLSEAFLEELLEELFEVLFEVLLFWLEFLFEFLELFSEVLFLEFAFLSLFVLF